MGASYSHNRIAMLTAALVSSLAPTAVNLAANFLTSPRQSSQERELRRLSKYFQEQAQTPYMQTTEGQARMRTVTEQDERNRRRATNQGIRAGATGEAQLAGTQAVNETTASATNQVAADSGNHRDRMLQSYLSTLEGAEQARLASEGIWMDQVSAISQGVGDAANAFAFDRLTNKKKKPTSTTTTPATVTA